MDSGDIALLLIFLMGMTTFLLLLAWGSGGR